MVTRERLLNAAQFVLSLAKERGNECNRLLKFKDPETRAEIAVLLAEARKLIDAHDVMVEVIKNQDAAINDLLRGPS